MDQQNEDQNYKKQNKLKKKNGFAQYNFIPQLYLNLIINKIKIPTPVQKKIIPVLMEGKDSIVCYKTGSGKTLGYLLPMINKLICHSSIIGARALILIPSRDLADQIAKVLRSFLMKINLKYSLILGGHNYEGQFESLSSNPDIIIATPGRLMQLLLQTDFKLSRVQIIVFDQADKLFEDGKFHQQLKQILNKCPISQRVMLSATITEHINIFTQAGLSNYTYIRQEICLPQTMKIDFYIVRSHEKNSLLLYLLQHVTGESRIILFVATRFHVDYIMSLIGGIYQCFGVYGKMDMQQRTFALNGFRRCKKSSILVVTDVAARGLDIPLVQFVIHYDYPTNHQIFIHRSGRTARNQEQGHAIAIITHDQVCYMTQIANYLSKPLCILPEKDSINFGSVPPSILYPYVLKVQSLNKKNTEIENYQKLANRAFLKFKKCRVEASENSLKRAKKLIIQNHYSFKGQIQEDEQTLMQKIHNYTPKKSYLQLHKLTQQNENDQFLNALDSIKKQQKNRQKIQQHKNKLRQKNSNKWKQILNNKEIKQYQTYERNINKNKIFSIEGVEIEIDHEIKKKSQQISYKHPQQYITQIKDPNKRTQFDDLPRIKTNQINQIVEDENPMTRQKKKVWDKSKKNYIWKKDDEDKMSKDEKGKKAYKQWKKKTKLSIPKVGQMEDPDQVSRARNNWIQRRKFRHGWKQNKQPSSKKPNLKNNKTKAIQKKLKKKMIHKNTKSKSRTK